MSYPNSNSDTEVARALFPIINDMLTPRFEAIGEGSGGGGDTTTLSPADYIDALLRDGSRSLLGDLDVASGKTVDGVDLSEFYASYIAHLTDDAHNRYVNTDVADTITAVHVFHPGSATAPFTLHSNAQNQVITGLLADHVNKTITPGTGLTSSGALTTGSGVTLNVGAGAGLVGNADDIAVGSGFGIIVNADSIEVDTSALYTWGDEHVFLAQIQTEGGIQTYGDIVPNATDAYDLGTSTKLFRKGWLSELDAILFATNTVTLIGGWFRIGKGEGAFPFDVSAVATTIDFGQAMTPNDFIEIRAALQLEYLQVGSVVTGTTYNVTRNLDGSGGNAWVAGTPYSIKGYTGNGWIDLNAYDTPRIQVFTQGATYNAQTENIRVGDLNGGWGYVAATYGAAFGEYASNKPNITIDPSNGIRIRSHTTDKLTFDTSGNASIAGVLNIGTNGGIYQGTGTFASPTTGLKLYNSAGVGLLAGYNSGIKQAGFNSSGEIDFAGGIGKLKASGLQFAIATGAWSGGTVSWLDGVTTRGSIGAQYNGAAWQMDLYGPGGTRLEIFSGQMDFYANATFKNSSVTVDTTLAVTGVTTLSSFLNTGGTSFPGSPVTNYSYFRRDFRAWFMYDGSAWQQTSVGAFSGSNPSSPTTGLRIYRTDLFTEYYYSGSAWVAYTWTPVHPGWTNVSFQNSWVNFGGGVYSDVQYYKDATGRVYLRGMAKNGTINTTMFTLPAGYRPASRMMRVTSSSNGAGAVYQRVDIEANGNVLQVNAGAGANVFQTFDDISFMSV